MSGCILQTRQKLFSVSKNLIPITTVRSQIHSSSKAVLFAQPTAASHAHLLKQTEVTPGISSNVYHNRRRNLMEKIIMNVSCSDNDTAHLVVIPSASVVYQSEKIPYPFRQNSDFLYLCGFKEPDSALVIHTTSKQFPDFKSTLFVPKQTTHSEQWEGYKMDLDTVTKFLNIDKALYIFNLENFLQSFVKSHKKVMIWYDYLNDSPFSIHQTIRDFMAAYSGYISMESPRLLVHQLRLIKCDAEINLMRNTCSIGAQSLKEVIKFSRSSQFESHLDAKMEYECRIRGADFVAFPPVVAGGDRGNTIHYIQNNQIINDGDMVLMDAGCECHGYNSDITRTWPVNGKFSNPQQELYEMLLLIQEQLIHLSKSKLSLDHLYKIMRKKLGKGLQELNIIPKDFTEVEACESASAFCPHHVGHYLGMDVHDTNTISRGIALQPGMVITIEPGIYISNSNKTVPEKYRGLCMRIEDDILITDEGCEVLTQECPKHVNKIEELFKNVSVC